MEEALKLTPEAVAHQKVPGEFSDNHIFLRMKQWIEDDKGFTYSHVLSRFKTFPTRALWLMHKFYSQNPHLNLRRAWMVFPEGKEQIEEDGSVTELTGYLATDSEVAKMEEDGKAIQKRLFSIHPAALDTMENIEYFNFDRMEAGGPARVKRLSNVDELKAIKKEAEERKQEQAMKINELFNKECDRPKHASPGKKKNETPPKPKEEFFSPSKRKPKSADKESPPKNRRRINFTKDEDSKSGVKMDDVFTTGEEEEDVNMEDIEEIPPQEEVPKKKASQKKGSQKKSQRSATNPPPEDDGDVKMEIEEDEDEAGPSNEPPRKVKELRTVQETTRDDEGFLVTSTQKKMVETDKIAPQTTKKKAAQSTTAAAPKKILKPAGSKQQTALTDFFKKK